MPVDKRDMVDDNKGDDVVGYRFLSHAGRRLAAGLLLLSACAASHADVVIGQVAPLSGVLASTGQQMVLGGKVWFDAVNAQGGVHGQKIRTIVLDDGYKVDETE